MNEQEMDAMPRMKDYLLPENLDTDSCVRLVGEIMKGLARDYLQARRKYNHQPTPENRQALDRIRDLYRSEWFRALSMGLVDPQTVMDELDRRL